MCKQDMIEDCSEYINDVDSCTQNYTIDYCTNEIDFCNMTVSY